MAAPEPPRLRSRRDTPVALPLDLVHEIVLRLPAADACRLRAVCRPWRALLSDPLFAATHAARHPDPLIAVGYDASRGNGRILCDIIDLSGRVVKRIHAGSGLVRERVMCVHLDNLIVARGSSMSCHLLNLSTGAVHVLPEGLADEHAKHEHTFSDCWATAAFGMVLSTGKYKVLRVLHSFRSDDLPIGKLYEVFTIDGSSSSSSSEARWRGKRAPPYLVELGDWYSVVIKHIVYILLSDYNSDYRSKQRLVASFDLEMEKWGKSIRGPMSRHDVYSIFINPLTCFYFKIAALGERLVLGCRSPFPGGSPSMYLWVLTDYAKGLWVKQHSIQISALHVPHLAQPLLVLNDGRGANQNGNWAFMKNDKQQIKTSTYEQQMKYCDAVGLYGANLLSLAN